MSFILSETAGVPLAGCPDVITPPPNYLGIVHTDPVTKAAWIAGPGSYRFQLRRVATYAIASGVQTNLLWDTEDVDESNNISVPATTITIPVSGLWLIDVRGALSNIITARAFANIAFVSTVPGVGTGDKRTTFYSDDHFGVMATAPLNAGDTITASVYQVSGSTSNITSAFIGGYWIGPNR